MTGTIPPGLALDIDETLSNTLHVYFDLLMNNVGNPEKLPKMELIKKYTYTYNVPYWQNKEANNLLEGARENNELYKTIPLIENSNHYVKKINELIPISCYLTIRPESVIDGTKNWLNKYGFPDREIIARPPNVDMKNSHAWKAKTLQNSFPKVLGIIDDNPMIIEHISPDYQGVIFLYSNSEYKHNTPLNIIPCPTWPDVYENVKKYLTTFLHQPPRR